MMELGTYVLLKVRRAFSGGSLPDGFELVAKGRNLVVLRWDAAFSDLSDVEEASERLWVELGSAILERHADLNGVLICPAARSQEPEASSYDDATTRYGAGGRWLTNVAGEPGGRLSAAERSEIPLPAMKGSKPGEFYVVKPARAVSELALGFEPLRVVRFELFTSEAPSKVSDFYSPLLRAKGFKVKRRVWSDGSAEQLIATSPDIDVVVHAQVQKPNATFVQVSWIEKA